MSSPPKGAFALSTMENQMPSSHTPILLFFPIPAEKQSQAIQVFREAFQSLIKSMPLLASSVSPVSCSTGQKGTMAITTPIWALDRLFFVKDLSGKSKYNYQSLRKCHFPPSALAMFDFARAGFFTMPTPPVLYIQLTILPGDGLVLGVNIHHSVADGPGSATIIRFLAAACRGEAPTSEKVDEVWRRPDLLSVTRLSSIPLEEGSSRYYLSPNADPMRSRNSIRQTKPWDFLLQPIIQTLSAFLISLVVSCLPYFFTARMISFTGADLVKLKAAASEAAGPYAETLQAKNGGGESPKFISTFDVVASLFYCSIASARVSVYGTENENAEKASGLWTRLKKLIQHLRQLTSLGFAGPLGNNDHIKSQNHKEDAVATLHYPKNMRSSFQPALDPETIGCILTMCHIPTPVSTFLPQTLSLSTIGQQARRIRAENLATDLSVLTRTCDALRSVPDVTRAVSKLDRRWDLVPTSWREQDMCRLDWGPGIVGKDGKRVKVESARLPALPFPGFFVIFPQQEGDGRLDIMVSLKKQEMKALQFGEAGKIIRQWGKFMD